MNPRIAQIERITTETNIRLRLNLDGEGKYEITTAVPFLDHMLSLFSRHSLIDLNVKAKGDLEIDDHHTVEDIGLCLGEAIQTALGTKGGIKRYGWCLMPMDESLVSVALDISQRPLLIFNLNFSPFLTGVNRDREFNPELVKEFFKALVSKAGLTLHLNLIYGDNSHHIIEALFKGFGKALAEACRIDPRNKGIPSTKSIL